MLEPFDAAKWTANIVAHFEDLTKAHEAVQRARAQLSALGPLLAECDAHDKVVAEIAALTAQRNALKYYFADLKAGLVDRLLDDLSSERARLRAQLTELAARLKDLRSRERSLDIELAGHGGNRLAEIDRLLKEGEAACRDRMDRAERFGKLLAEAGLDPVETAEHFAARRHQIAAARDRAKQDLADAQNRLTDAGYAAKALGDKAAGVNAELVSLREHPNNIPKRQLDLRAWMCRELRLDARATRTGSGPGSSPTCGIGSTSPRLNATARTTPSTSTTQIRQASQAGRRRSWLWGIHLTGLDSSDDGTGRGRALPEIDRRVPFLVRH